MFSNNSTFDLQSNTPPPFRQYTQNEWWAAVQRWAKLKFRSGPNQSTEITAIQEESISLKKLVVDDFNAWMAAHGLDLGAAQKRAEEAVRKLKGA